VSMVGHKRKGIAKSGGLWDKVTKTGKKAFFVDIIGEDLSSFYPPDHDMVENTGSIDAGLSRHGRIISSEGEM
jgi:hypothetical protein